jgi:hypothetical protein
VSGPDLRSWFAEGELVPCPQCGTVSALPTPRGGFLVCLECGLIDPDGDRLENLAADLAQDLASGVERSQQSPAQRS